FLQLLLCVAPFLYLILARAPIRHYVRAAAIALTLAAIPVSLGAAASRWEHASLPADQRRAAAAAEARADARLEEMISSLQTLRDRIRQSDVSGARNAWLGARGPFVQLEPLVARVDPEAAEELNGEPGEAAGFHGIEATLFQSGGTWAGDPDARKGLLADVDELLARSRSAAGLIRSLTLSPATVRGAWAGHRWTMVGRIDGQESFASQSSITEWRATLDAIDADLGYGGFFTAPIREALEPALTRSAEPPSYGEARPELRTTPEQLHVAVPLTGPDRVWDSIDRARLLRAVEETFTRVEQNGPAASAVAPATGG
ncbi:MAG TPA: hypothetical protein VID50_08415, partial [Candidatus Eisenbacteria bacterium]